MSDWGRLGAVPLAVGFGPEPGVGASVRVAVDSNYITHSQYVKIRIRFISNGRILSLNGGMQFQGLFLCLVPGMSLLS